MNQPTVRTPQEIATQAPVHVPFLRIPEARSVFADRARRLDQLADGHSMGPYLKLIARVARAQQNALDGGLPILPPESAKLDRAREHGMPPLDPSHVRRDPLWHDVLRRMLRAMVAEGEDTGAEIMTRLEGSRGDFYEGQASKLLAGITLGVDCGTAPFIGAALQVYWTHLVTMLGSDAFPTIDVPNVCPCCGSRPTASIARIGAEASGYRYLHCSLCAAEWHMVRIKCTHCDTTKGIQYVGIEGAMPAVKAECCESCGTYLKIMSMDKDPHVDPVADDLASVALDLLVGETGLAGSGVNLMLVYGDADDQARVDLDQVDGDTGAPR